MPYRRLPNTDKARLRALERAYKKIESDGHNDVPFSQNTIQCLRNFLPRFQNAIILLDAARNNQVQKSKDYAETLRKARMYVSHYIQVMNMAISRGEQKASIRLFYKLEEYGNSVPPLNSESDLLYWGKQIIEGDRERTSLGGSPFYNPSIALVKVNFEKYADAHFHQKNLQQTTTRSSSQVNEFRAQANELIQQIWNETEAAFDKLPDAHKREKSKQYGVVYAFRKSELIKAEKEKNKIKVLQQQLAF
jgi:acyl-CoA synthetase (NDP forming)